MRFASASFTATRFATASHRSITATQFATASVTAARFASSTQWVGLLLSPMTKRRIATLLLMTAFRVVKAFNCVISVNNDDRALNSVAPTSNLRKR